MYKGITPDYYGSATRRRRALPKEAEAEKRAIDEAEAEHRAKRQQQLEAARPSPTAATAISPSTGGAHAGEPAAAVSSGALVAMIDD